MQVQRLCDDRLDEAERAHEKIRFENEERMMEKDELIRNMDESLRSLEDKYHRLLLERDDVTDQLRHLTQDYQQLKVEHCILVSIRLYRDL